MDEIRVNRIRAMMKDELSVLINRELKDPRIPFVTVTQVELTRDAKQATVFVSVLHLDQSTLEEKAAREALSDDERIEADEAAHVTRTEITEGCISALIKAKGYLRKQLSAALGLRYVPDLLFKEDKGLENTLRVNELLKQISNERK